MALKLPGGWVISRPGQVARGRDVAAQAPDPGAIEAATAEKPVCPEAAPKPSAKTKTPKTPKRALLLRLFGVSPWGAVKLLGLCILVGGAVMVWQEAQRAAEGNGAMAARQAAAHLWSGAVWAAQNFWQPALYGAGVMAPFWVLWRVITLPFRK